MVLTTSGHVSGTNYRMLQTLAESGNVTVLERPVRAITLVAAIRTALRARRRQYETRDYLAVRERVEAELRVARAAAERESRAKDNFLAMLGHELRNPLAAIVNGAAVLDRFEARAEAESRSRTIIGRQAQHLSRLIDDLLDVSRIMSGKIALRRDPVDLREVVRQCVESRHAAVSHSHRVSLVTDARPVVVEGDPVRLEQIAGNLIDNAVKYSPPGEPIHVVARRENGEAVLSVEDRGIGLAAEMLESIFEPFTQTDVSLHRARGGLGLGLAVVKGLVEQHGGPRGRPQRGSRTGQRVRRASPPRRGGGRPLGPSSGRPPPFPDASSWSRITTMRARRSRSSSRCRATRSGRPRTE